MSPAGGVVGLCLLTLAPLAAAGDPDKPVLKGKTGQALDEAVQKVGGPDFWGSVLVARRGEVLLAKGYGLADYEKTPNTPLTLFELASASKQFTAAAVLHLHQRRKLDVSDPLSRFFEDAPEDKKDITVHQLLTHTSGLSGRIGVPYASPIPRDAYIREMLAAPLASPPGEKFEYCNAGYALLAAIVEVVSKVSFEDYCRRHLFQPARLKSTGFIQDRELIQSGRSTTRRAEGMEDRAAADWHWGWGYRGMGGVVTQVYDLLRWDQALRAGKILSEATQEILFEPVLEGYACGWRVSKTAGGGRRAEHAGSVAGYGANLVRHLDEELLIVVLSNDPARVHPVTRALYEEL